MSAVLAVRPTVGSIRRVRAFTPRAASRILVWCGLALVPWAALLATLPGGRGWAVLDLAEATALIIGGIRLHQGQGAHRFAVALAAALLLGDACCDLATAAPGSELAAALLMAVCAEGPLAVLCGRLALDRPTPVPTPPRPHRPALPRPHRSAHRRPHRPERPQVPLSKPRRGAQHRRPTPPPREGPCPDLRRSPPDICKQIVSGR
ncbi:hypothetical protein GCM10023235_25930 [Kitasatospora terrestris]|uniref:Uncharacterized protein n=1 Tax=Kitasatospora terrestris TaxID=258051 RepID=A0ABP9DIX2_9ACTN